MKKVNDKELNQINGGYADRYFWQETLLNKDEEKDTNEIVVTENEDGTVTASGGW